MGYVGVLVRSKGYVAVTRRNEITMYALDKILITGTSETLVVLILD